MKRLVVIGAGPMGLEAALLGVERGYQVTVLERGRVGESLRDWGRVRFFTPFAMNASARARALLGPAGPKDAELLTGPEMIEQVLLPLSESAPLAGKVHTQAQVVAVGRARTLRRDLPKNPLRAGRPFRILYEQGGEERVMEAELVLDASGVTRPTYLGVGGQPALGERQVNLHRSLGALERALPGWAGRRVMLVGHGHSAAHAIAWLAELVQAAPGTTVSWVVRSQSARPCVEVASDPLPERAATVRRANELAAAPPPWLTVLRKAQVESIRGAGPYQVGLSGARTLAVEGIVGLTGYRPELEHLSELPLELSAVTEGARGIQQALANVTDCLKAPALSPKDLESGEPGFYLIGQKAYGRMTAFLLENGRAQVETIFQMVGAEK